MRWRRRRRFLLERCAVLSPSTSCSGLRRFGGRQDESTKGENSSSSEGPLAPQQKPWFDRDEGLDKGPLLMAGLMLTILGSRLGVDSDRMSKVVSDPGDEQLVVGVVGEASQESIANLALGATGLLETLPAAAPEITLRPSGWSSGELGRATLVLNSRSLLASSSYSPS